MRARSCRVYSAKSTAGTGSQISTTYIYDGSDRLKTATPSSGTAYTYTYDADSNLRSAKEGSATTYYGYNEADQLCWSGSTDSSSAAMGQSCQTAPSGDTTYRSDGDGNNLGSTTGPVHYNSQGQVDQISSPSGAGPVSQTYLDQGNNLRLSAGIATGTHTTSTDTFTQGGPLGITARTTTIRVSGAVTGTALTYYARDPYGQILDEGGASGTYYYETDGQGSIVGMLDSAGNLAATYAYSSYGVSTVIDGTSSTAGDNSPWRYTGGYQDTTDGYYHFGARYYDTAGHFTQADSIAGNISRPEKYNAYTYTAGDPLNNSDINGDFSFSLGGKVCAFGGCIGGSVGIDSDGDVNVSGSIGVGSPGVGGGAAFDPNGDCTEGGNVSVSAPCTAGPATVGVSADSSRVSPTSSLNSSYAETPSCSADVNGSYTF